MPLNVLGREYRGLRNTTIGQNLTTRATHRGYAGMGGFYVNQFTAPPVPPMLSTDSASPCLIIVVHCSNGKGALAHFAAHDNPAVVTQAVQYMVACIPAARPLDTIVIAGGGGVTGLLRAPVTAAVRAGFGGVDVRWPVPDANDMESAYTAAIYAPTLSRLALFDDDDTVNMIPSPDSVLLRFNQLV